MTQEEFNGLPLLLTRAQVVGCGIPEERIDELKVAVRPGAWEVAAGRIGWVVFNGARQGKYRKGDVAAVMGLRMR